MTESADPQTPEEAALRALATKHRRRHRWVALFSSLVVSAHTTIILYTVWHDWPLDACDLMWLVFFVVNALGGLVWLALSLRGLRAEEAIDRRLMLRDVRWRARDRAWPIDAEATSAVTLPARHMERKRSCAPPFAGGSWNVQRERVKRIRRRARLPRARASRGLKSAAAVPSRSSSATE